MIRDAAESITPPPSSSPWWWLIPPVGYALQLRRRRAYLRRVMNVLTHAQMEQLVRFGNKATGWILISTGAGEQPRPAGACHAGLAAAGLPRAVLKARDARLSRPAQSLGRPGCLRISTTATISNTEPKVIRAYRTPCSLNELPIPTRNSTAARKTVIWT
jgi:hypothetical protein